MKPPPITVLFSLVFSVAGSATAQDTTVPSSCRCSSESECNDLTDRAARAYFSTAPTDAQSMRRILRCAEEACVVQHPRCLDLQFLTLARTSEWVRACTIEGQLQRRAVLDDGDEEHQNLRQAMRRYVGWITVDSTSELPQGTTFRIDGEAPTARAVDVCATAGPHTVVMTVPGRGEVTRDVNAIPGEHRSITLEAPSIPPSAPPFYTRWWFWTLVGIGVAGTSVGVYCLDDPLHCGDRPPLPSRW